MEEVLRIEVGFSSLRASFDVLPNADDLFESNIAGDYGDNGGETSGELLLRAHCVKAACHGGDCLLDCLLDWSVLVTVCVCSLVVI